ncbi:P-loop containing nucleoside triphosphate hydrolase protein [Pelagophyceae sp. CCMP2097]|nr:P-loop containing nucleoside triphosphate hydrolase protein [Pelagophyceae sp. CCMP2097]
MPSRWARRKVVLLGDFGVGKTSFCLRLAQGTFKQETTATLGVAQFAYDVVDWLATHRLDVWDTAGQERYRSLDTMRLYLRGAEAAVVLFDVTSQRTFEAAKLLVRQLRDDVEVGPDFVISLVANKCDITTAAHVPAAEIDSFVFGHGLLAARTSCKTGDNVRDAVVQLCGRLPAAAAESSTAAELVMPTMTGDACYSSSC